MQNYNLPSVCFGNTFDSVTMTLPSLDAFNLTGASIIMKLKSDPDDSVAVATYRNDGDTPMLEIIGDFSFKIKEHKVGIAPGEYYYDVLIIFATGVRKTYIGGTWKIDKVITTETV